MAHSSTPTVQSSLSYDKINAFALSPAEESVIAGDMSGRLILFSSSDLTLQHIYFQQWGAISAIACRERDGLVAVLSMDRFISIWRYRDGKLDYLDRFSFRDMPCQNQDGPVFPIRSESQALSIHPHLDLIATRSGQGDLLLLDVNQNRLELNSCIRFNEQYDLVACQFTGKGEEVLTGTVRGHVSLVNAGVVQKEWKIEHESVHWFEPIEPGVFLIASDARRVARLDLNRSEMELDVGGQFARDDFEHITVDKLSGRIYGTSFDRNIYEIDAETLTPIRTVAQLPFKLRWVKVMKGSPGRLVVQCRDGALYILDQDTGAIRYCARQTPHAMWTAELIDGNRLLLAGESSRLIELSISPDRRVGYRWRERLPEKKAAAAYVKRMLLRTDHVQPEIIVGRIDGTLIRFRDGRGEELYRSPGGIRDISLSPDQSCLWFADEEGHVGGIDLASVSITAKWKSDKPLRSIAIDPTGKYLAVSERIGDLVILGARTLTEHRREQPNRTAKRMKWLDEKTLLYNVASSVYVYDFSAGSAEMRTAAVGNTVEDFIWDPDRRYLMTVNYMREVTLSDLKTGRLLDRVIDDYDYSKGLVWLGDTEFGRHWGPSCFVTFGRSGRLNIYQIYEERIMLRERIAYAED